MTNTQSLDNILTKHNGELGVTWEDPDVVTSDTKQAILQWAADTLLDDSDIPNVMIAMEHNRQREALKREGWRQT